MPRALCAFDSRGGAAALEVPSLEPAPSSQGVARRLASAGIWLNLIRYETAIEKQVFKALEELSARQYARSPEKDMWDNFLLNKS